MMSRDETQQIFQSWREYMEIADRFSSLMLTPPPSFLPYPVATLEEALNIVAKDYWDAGDRRMAETIQETAAGYLTPYFFTETHELMTDEEALVQMRRMIDLMLGDEPLKKTLLEKLKASQARWIEIRQTRKSQ